MVDMREILASLPQAGVIEQPDAERWLRSIMRYHAPRSLWHAKRLGGFGGSEIGAVIRGLKGIDESGFSTLDRVVEQKLMKRLPEFETIHMKRGNVLEHLARLAFLYRYKAQRDEAATQAVANAKSRSGYEWLVGNPDDYVLINGRRFLTDYKVPSSFDEEVAFDYSAQLHHYDLLGQMAQVKAEGMILAKLDLAPEFANSLVERIPKMSDQDLHDMAQFIARADMPGMRIVGIMVERSRPMQLDILDCGSTAWSDFVLQGVVPPKFKGELVELDDSAILAVGQYQHQYAMAKSGIKYLTSVVEAATAGITARLDGVSIEGKELPLSLVKINNNTVDKERVIEEAQSLGAKPEEIGESPGYSVVALLEEIKRLNGDPEAAHLKAEPVPQFDKAKDYLKALGVDAGQFKAQGVSLRMSTGKKDKEVAGIFERSASERFCAWLDEAAIGKREADDDQLENAIQDFDLEVASGTLHEVFSGVEDDEKIHNLTPLKRSSASLR